MDWYTDEIIRDYIDSICEILKIDSFDIGVGYSADIGAFATPTEMAHYNFKENYILFNENYLVDLENTLPYIVFKIAHELRHVWQRNNNWNKTISKHKSSKYLSIEEYNRQPEEVDANAFATIITDAMFGCDWDRIGFLSNTICKDLEKQMEKIVQWLVA